MPKLIKNVLQTVPSIEPIQIDVQFVNTSGNKMRDRQIKKCSGVIAWKSSGSVDNGHIGQEFRAASI